MKLIETIRHLFQGSQERVNLSPEAKLVVKEAAEKAERIKIFLGINTADPFMVGPQASRHIDLFLRWKLTEKDPRVTENPSMAGEVNGYFERLYGQWLNNDRPLQIVQIERTQLAILHAPLRLIGSKLAKVMIDSLGRSTRSEPYVKRQVDELLGECHEAAKDYRLERNHSSSWLGSYYA